MCSLVFMWVPNNCCGGYPKSCHLYVDYVLLVELPCMPSVGDDARSLTKIFFFVSGDKSGVDKHSENGRMDWGKIVGGGD